MAHLYRALRMCAMQRKGWVGVFGPSSLFKSGFRTLEHPSGLGYP
jgi:hypothetical protein